MERLLWVGESWQSLGEGSKTKDHKASTALSGFRSKSSSKDPVKRSSMEKENKKGGEVKKAGGRFKSDGDYTGGGGGGGGDIDVKKVQHHPAVQAKRSSAEKEKRKSGKVKKGDGHRKSQGHEGEDGGSEGGAVGARRGQHHEPVREKRRSTEKESRKSGEVREAEAHAKSEGEEGGGGEGGEDKNGQHLAVNVTKSGRMSIPVLDHWRSEHATTKNGQLVIIGGNDISSQCINLPKPIQCCLWLVHQPTHFLALLILQVPQTLSVLIRLLHLPPRLSNHLHPPRRGVVV